MFAVPAAFAICSLAPDDPWLACRLAASAGGDCDTIAAMAGAILGACHGTAKESLRWRNSGMMTSSGRHHDVANEHVDTLSALIDKANEAATESKESRSKKG